MKYDAFAAGINPGGLRTKTEIRILICYLLSSVQEPLSKEALTAILTENGLANYFETAEALGDLAEKGILTVGKGQPRMYSAGGSARMIAGQLETELPPTVRRRALCAAVSLLGKVKREKENTVEIRKTSRGFLVTCHISGGEEDLMSVSLRVPDRMQADLVRENFQRSPETVYRVFLALMTGDRTAAADLLKGGKPEKREAEPN